MPDVATGQALGTEPSTTRIDTSPPEIKTLSASKKRDYSPKVLLVLAGALVAGLIIVLAVSHFLSSSTPPPAAPSNPPAASTPASPSSVPESSLPDSGGTRDPFAPAGP